MIPLLLAPASTLAKDELVYVSVLGGVVFPTDGSPGAGFGASLGFFDRRSRWGYNAIFTSNTVSVTTGVSGIQITAERTNQFFGVDYLYHFRRSWTGLNAGVRGGFSSISVLGEVGADKYEESFGRMALGPKVGYDFYSWLFSWGAEISFMIGFGENAPNVFAIYVPLRIHFCSKNCPVNKLGR